MGGRDIPLRIGDVQTGVSGLHVLSGVDAGAAGGLAEEINNVGLHPHLGSVIKSGKELRQLRIGGQPADEIVGDGHQRVVAAQAGVKRRLAGGGARRADYGGGEVAAAASSAGGAEELERAAAAVETGSGGCLA